MKMVDWRVVLWTTAIKYKSKLQVQFTTISGFGALQDPNSMMELVSKFMTIVANV